MALFGKKQSREELLDKGKALFMQEDYARASLVFQKLKGGPEKDYWVGSCFLGLYKKEGKDRWRIFAKSYLTAAVEKGHPGAAMLLKNELDITVELPEGSAPFDLPSEPIPEPIPEPVPEPIPEPVPEPIPEPIPEPAPEPIPEPTPDPFQEAVAAFESGDFATALALFEPLARQGNVKAQLGCGTMYDKGQGTAVDKAKALYWLEQAAGQSDGEVQLECSVRYYTGEGTAKDLEKALYWARQAAGQGLEKAEEFLEILDQEERADRFARANAACSAGDYAGGLALFEQLAEEGSVNAQFNCGTIYADGRGVPADAAKGLYWFEKAAEQGMDQAQYNCALMYSSGEGTAVDESKALYWFEKAAEQGVAEAQYNCGIMYLHGEGTPKDTEKALMWLEKAADQGLEEAIGPIRFIKQQAEDLFRQAADAVRDGEYGRALPLFEKLAEEGVAEAQLNCGLLYDSGRGTKKHPAKALYWYEQAANQGNATAQIQCARMYQSGQGTSHDAAKALYWLGKAARQGDDKAIKDLPYQKEIAYREAKAAYQAKDYQKALSLYRMLAEYHDTWAEYWCGILYENGLGAKKDMAQAEHWYSLSLSHNFEMTDEFQEIWGKKQVSKLFRKVYDAYLATRIEDFNQEVQKALQELQEERRGKGQN